MVLMLLLIASLTLHWSIKFKISVSRKSVLGTDKNITCPDMRIIPAKPTVLSTKTKLIMLQHY
jgi:hypothetical protein